MRIRYQGRTLYTEDLQIDTRNLQMSFLVLPVGDSYSSIPNIKEKGVETHTCMWMWVCAPVRAVERPEE